MTPVARGPRFQVPESGTLPFKSFRGFSVAADQLGAPGTSLASLPPVRRPGPCEPQRVAQTASCGTFPSALNELRRHNGQFEKLPFGLLVPMLFLWRKPCRPESQPPFQRGAEKTNFSSASLCHFVFPLVTAQFQCHGPITLPHQGPHEREARTIVWKGGGYGASTQRTHVCFTLLSSGRSVHFQRRPPATR